MGKGPANRLRQGFGAQEAGSHGVGPPKGGRYGSGLPRRSASGAKAGGRHEEGSVSVVIPCRNEAEYIEQLLDAVRAQDRPPDEIVVADNGSTDDSEAIARAYAARHPDTPIIVLHCPDEGAGAAMNAGIRVATGDVIVRLDGHSTPRRDYIRNCLARLAEPNAGVVGGVWEIVPGAGTLRARAIALAVGSPLGSGGAAYRHSDVHPAPRDVDTVPFGCYTKDLWRTMHGYDATLLVVEDGEFNYRVRKAGFRVILDPEIRTTYYPRRRLRTLGRQYLRYGWWKIPMLLRHPRSIRLRQMIPLGFVATVLALAFAGIWFPPATAALLALLAVWGGALLLSALGIARRERDLRLAPFVAGAFAVIHFSWGLGGLLHIVTLGQLPRWRLPPPATELDSGGVPVSRVSRITRRDPD
jgi:succinoglycan biosynthesis protein ExoA